MDDNNARLTDLQSKLDALLLKHEAFSHDIKRLNEEIQLLKNAGNTSPISLSVPEIIEDHKVSDVHNVNPLNAAQQDSSWQSPQQPSMDVTQIYKKPRTTSSIEKFIGENLINKIGILITVIGVGIGAKYSIENNLISPLTRIILGYLFGFALLATGAKLKGKYLNYSAVLVSGAVAILYFITFFAYSFYQLIPSLLAFGLMFIFTAFTIIAALKYDKQIIAHLGLVGAYAIPLLLSDGTGRVEIMLTYIALINVGILVLSFKKYWKALFYSAFGLSWIFMLSWLLGSFDAKVQFWLAATFLTVFFMSFYICFLAYKVLKKENFEISNIIILLLNSFLFYGLGISVLLNLDNGDELLGLFTLGNALVHFLVSAFIYKQKLADKNLFYLIAGLVLVFATLAVPVQMDGNWVTLIWTGEAALLFWIGRSKKVAVYEKLSYILMVLAVTSLLQDWSAFYDVQPYFAQMEKATPLWNTMFFTSVLFIACFGFIQFISSNNKNFRAFPTESIFSSAAAVLIPVILISISYFAILLELEHYGNLLYYGTKISAKNGFIYDEALPHFKTLWSIIFSLFYFTVLAILNLKMFKNARLAYICGGLLGVFMLVFLTSGLLALSSLRDLYLAPDLNRYFEPERMYLGIRYISYVAVAVALVTLYYTNRMYAVHKKSLMWVECFLHLCFLWIASSELINWLAINGQQETYKLGITILWGVYALLLIALGIWKNKQYFRIGGILLFGITLIKLFLYDITVLGGGSKTILFVSLGILLLIISFLYNKYKHLIFGEGDHENTGENEN